MVSALGYPARSSHSGGCRKDCQVAIDAPASAGSSLTLTSTNASHKGETDLVSASS
jgi:hypothetical protein